MSAHHPIFTSAAEAVSALDVIELAILPRGVEEHRGLLTLDPTKGG